MLMLKLSFTEAYAHQCSQVFIKMDSHVLRITQICLHYPSGNSYTFAHTSHPALPYGLQHGFKLVYVWGFTDLPYLSSLHSGMGSYAAVQPHGFSDTCILRHRQSLTHKLIDLWFVVRVENSCCRLIKYSRRFNAKYWKTLSGRRVKFLKTCLSRGSRPVQEDLHLAMINVSSGSGGGLEGCQAHGVKFTLGLALWISYISLRPWFFQGVQQSCSAWTSRSKSSPTWAEALQHIGRAGWSPRCSLTSPYLRGQMESLFL